LGLTIISLFTCVVLHEYGHALTARRYGIQTKDILLTPIGGIARLNGLPKKPIQEFIIAIAGPLVNVAIMLLAMVYLFFAIDSTSTELLEDLIVIDSFSELVLYLFFLNFILFAFNLIPAFPMDGGRILRSLLSLKMEKLKATRIASFTGQALAVVFVIVAFVYQQFSLGFIGVFVFIMARKEYKMAAMEARIQKASVGEIMRSGYTFFYDFDPISKALLTYNTGDEKSFIVFNQLNQVVGVIHELFLTNLDSRFAESDSIRNILSSKFEFISPEMPVIRLFHLMQESGYSILPVLANGLIVGVVDRKDVMNFIRK
jgi:Zn-dependent protease/predicted transcriptional regulator